MIGLKANNFHDYPDWNQLPLARVRGERPEDHQIVKWHYDKTSGHDDETVGSPRGTQLGMMVVTDTFATEAVAAFPGVVTIMTEVEARDFYENKAVIHLSADRVSADVLTGLKARRDLMVDLGQSTVALDAQITKALDPDDAEPGVRKNPRKTFDELKTDTGLTIKP